MCDCCECNKTDFKRKFFNLKEMFKELVARQERNVEMMRELYEMLPLETQQKLKDEKWFEKRCDEWTKQYRENQRKERFV